MRPNWNPDKLQFNPRGFIEQSHRNEYNNQRNPSGVKPMGVDCSIQTRRVIYMNKLPLNQNQKYPLGLLSRGQLIRYKEISI